MICVPSKDSDQPGHLPADSEDSGQLNGGLLCKPFHNEFVSIFLYTKILIEIKKGKLIETFKNSASKLFSYYYCLSTDNLW